MRHRPDAWAAAGGADTEYVADACHGCQPLMTHSSKRSTHKTIYAPVSLASIGAQIMFSFFFEVCNMDRIFVGPEKCGGSAQHRMFYLTTRYLANCDSSTFAGQLVMVRWRGGAGVHSVIYVRRLRCKYIYMGGLWWPFAVCEGVSHRRR